MSSKVESMNDSVSYTVNVENFSSDIITMKTYLKNDTQYGILKYDKNKLTVENIENTYYRSIITTAAPEHRILSFSPPKALTNNSFYEKYSEINDDILVNEIVEGTMINLFFDDRVQKWEIASKGAVGCSYFYYRNQYDVDSDKSNQLTFYQMFMDAMCSKEGQQLNDLAILEYLPKTHSYSFVLQHPENHIVLTIPSPKLYLVAVYEKVANTTVKYIPPTVFSTWEVFANSNIQVPKQYKVASYDEAKETYCSIQNDFTSIGVMCVHLKTGDRTCIKNASYEEIKLLRGNNPNLQYQYLCVRRMNKVKDFLYYFPQYRGLFYRFYQDFENFINNVHISYLSYYIQKQEIVISKKYAPHVFKIHHEVYLPSLQTEEPIIVKRRVVKEYFEKMEPRELIYHLNYDRRMYMKSFLNESAR
jgi:hypothetical protein